MGYYQYRMYEPMYRDCLCDSKHNLVMEMATPLWPDGPFWVLCDYCGNKTKVYDRSEDAEFKWNEFQYARVPKLTKEVAVTEIELLERIVSLLHLQLIGIFALVGMFLSKLIGEFLNG